MGFSLTDTISSGWASATNAASRVSESVSGAVESVSDLGSRAVDHAKDLGRTGLDAGRRSINAVRDFDVRAAADTVRTHIAEGTEAAREGIGDAVTWTSQEVGKGAQWAKEHVPGGDNLVSNAARGVIQSAADNTRFSLGVTGGVLREVVGTAGAVGQLGVTAAEMQASPEAAAEYGQKMLDGVSHMATATADYASNVAHDPSRFGDDLAGAYDTAADFVASTADRYGQAMAEGRMEEIGMDVGTVATYVVPVGGGPLRGAATAAVRDGATALTRSAAPVLSGAAHLAEKRGATLLEGMAASGGTMKLEQGAGRVADIAAASRQSGTEIAVYRNANGERMITQGSERAVTVPADSRLIAHTQPGIGQSALTPSAADFDGLATLGQRSSAIIDEGGNLSRFHVEGDLAPRGPATGNVAFEAPAATGASKIVTTPQGGRIDYGQLDALGRPTGVTARITPDMIGTGTKADSGIHPPGWSGNGTLHNESRGHLLGNQLGGSGDLRENLVTLQQNPANSPVMRDFETQVRNTVEGGEPVNYSSIPDYQGDNLVARGITLSAQGDNGFKLDVTILNPIANN